MSIIPEYILTTDNTSLPLTTTEVNDHLKESFADISTETYLALLIKSVQKFGEQFTRREFLTKTFTVYFNNWCYSYELKKSLLGAISSVKYIDADGDTQTVDSSLYGTTESTSYSKLYFKDDFTYPSLNSENPQPIIIEFTAGYGLTESSIPDAIKTAMLHHLAKLWQSRGDCPLEGKNEDTIITKALPPEARLLYSANRIQDIRI